MTDNTSCQTVREYYYAFCPYCGKLNTEEDELLDLLSKAAFILHCKYCEKDSTIIFYDSSHTTITEDK